MAMMIVNNAKTAEPIAIMDATLITSMRTGAAGAIAAKYLARRNSKTMSVFGAGNQAYYQILGMLTVFPGLQSIRLYDPSLSAMKSLVKKIKPLFKGELVSCSSGEECVKDSDIIATTTPSRKPILKNEWISEGVHINAIGADAPGKQELDPAILKRAKIFVDDREQASHSGEINVPLHKKQISSSGIFGVLGEAVTGKKKREKDNEITIFDSTGLAIQDIYAADWIIKQAKKSGKAKQIIFETG